MNLPRVLHLAPLGGISGALRSMQVLVGELATRGPTFVLCLDDGPEAHSIAELGATVTPVFAHGNLPRRRLPRWSRLVAAIVKTVRRNDIQAIHCHSAQLMRYAWPAALAMRVPIVCHQRELYERLWTQRWLGRADRIIAISKAVRQSLPTSWLDRTTLIYNGVVGPERLPAHEIGDRPVRIGVAGRIIHEKGQDLLVAAATALMDRFDIEVEIWGLHPHRPPNGFARSLLDQIDALGDRAQRFRVEKMRDDIDAFYRHIDIAVVPSRCIEGLGRVAIEAMAWGRPVVVAGHGGLTEIVQHDDTGLTFNPGDWRDLMHQIERLLRDVPLQNRLRTQAHADYLERFTPRRHADHVVALYADLLNR